MYCSECGKEIHDKAVVCPNCGCATKNLHETQERKNDPIIINNNTSSSSSAAASASSTVKIKKHHSLLFDIFMICITGGLWIIWMILRPKYY